MVCCKTIIMPFAKLVLDKILNTINFVSPSIIFPLNLTLPYFDNIYKQKSLDTMYACD